MKHLPADWVKDYIQALDEGELDSALRTLDQAWEVCFVTRKSMLTSTQPEWYATDVLSQLLPLPLPVESSA